MRGNEIDRRTVLKTTGAALATGLLGSTAGCLGGGSGKFANWMHPPGEFTDVDHYRATYYDISAFVEHEDNIPSDTFDLYEGFVEESVSAVGVDFDEISSMLTTNVSTHYSVEQKKEDLVAELEDNDFDDEDELEGFTTFLGPDEQFAVAVKNKQVVTAEKGENPLDVVEYAVEAGAGAEDRYVDESEDMKLLTEEVDEGTITYVETQEEADSTDVENGQFDHQVGSGGHFDFEGKTASATRVILFEGKDDVDMDEITEWSEMDGTDEPFDDFDDISVSQSGRLATVTATIDLDDLLS